MEVISGIEQKIATSNDTVWKLQTELGYLVTENAKMTKEIQSLLSRPTMTDEFKKSAKALIEDLQRLTETKKELLETVEDYDIVAQLLKDGGIKTKVVRQYIPIINGLVNKYLGYLDFFVNFTMDEQFNEHIKSRHRDEFRYGSFSEGQKKRIDLALLFTWREVAKIKNSTNTNLLIFDEVLDGSLDSNGTEELMKYLSSDSEDGTNIFIISHNTDILSEQFDKRFRFYLDKEFSFAEEK
jgi:wobble nucleotide-excising tRNase